MGINEVELLLGAFAAVITVAGYFMSWSVERPTLSVELPFTKDDWPNLGIDHLKWFCVRLINTGNHPAHVTRFLCASELIVDTQPIQPATARFPQPLSTSSDAGKDARGLGHSVAPGQKSQYLHIGHDFEALHRDFLSSPQENLHGFLQILVEYEDNFGRLYRSQYQYRYVYNQGGFRLAWPSHVANPWHKKAGLYVGHRTVIGTLRAFCRGIPRYVNGA